MRYIVNLIVYDEHKDAIGEMLYKTTQAIFSVDKKSLKKLEDFINKTNKKK